jgi:hypothetical protein
MAAPPGSDKGTAHLAIAGAAVATIITAINAVANLRPADALISLLLTTQTNPNWIGFRSRTPGRMLREGKRARSEVLIFFVILTETSERSLRGRTSDSFAKAKPVPVPNLRIQISVILSGSRWSRKISAKRFDWIRS